MAYPQTSFAAAEIHGNSLVGRRRQAVSENTLAYQLDVLKKTGRYDAFKLQWHPVYDEPPSVWPIPNHLFWDSDVAKWIEGACYFLKHQSLPEIDEAVQELIEMIRSAQQSDGYLNIHYTVVEPGKRFTNLRDMHELYNAGHMIEAALAHSDLYRNDRLLGPILRYVDLLCKTFGPGTSQIHGYPGHPEIELALLRLYDRTTDPKHLALAKYFITERGNPSGVDGENYFVWEAKARGDDPSKRPAFYPEPQCLWYHQAHAPIAEQKSVEGHSVRAMYLLTAVADLCRIESDATSHKLHSAMYTLWDNMTQRKMYVTGGIGAIKQWEGFGQDYFLPQGTDEGGCYAETCASIGVMMLAQRILQIDLDGKFADIMELCLYNAVLTAMSHDGKGFTYVNQLASSDIDPSKRNDWFTVACCPPNMLRILGYIGGYVWTRQDEQNAVTVNLYIPSTLEFTAKGENVRISQQGNWPWEERIQFSVDTSSEDLSMKLRIPQWAPSFEINPPCPDAVLEKGYLTLPATWLAKHPEFDLHIPLKVRWLAPHPSVEQNTITLARGLVIYCVEDVDNEWEKDHFKGVSVDPEAALTEKVVRDPKTGDDYVSLTLESGARNVSPDDLRAYPSLNVLDLKSSFNRAKEVKELRFIPYYFRANRAGKGHMRAGLKRMQK